MNIYKWLKNIFRRKDGYLHVPEVVFLGEQDGPPERILKNALSKYYDSVRVVRCAYLARVHYGSPSKPSVALLLRTTAINNHDIIAYSVDIFKGIFGYPQYLDVIVLDEEREAELTKQCRPFYLCSVPK